MRYSKDLDFFLDKPCTIITTPINWRYDVVPMMSYFVGIVYRIDSSFVWIRHPQTKLITTFDLSSIIGISQEQMLSENVPEEKKLIDEYRKEKPEIAEKTAISGNTNKPNFLNIKELTELSKKLKT